MPFGGKDDAGLGSGYPKIQRKFSSELHHSGFAWEVQKHIKTVPGNLQEVTVVCSKATEMARRVQATCTRRGLEGGEVCGLLS